MEKVALIILGILFLIITVNLMVKTVRMFKECPWACSIGLVMLSVSVIILILGMVNGIF